MGCRTSIRAAVYSAYRGSRRRAGSPSQPYGVIVRSLLWVAAVGLIAALSMLPARSSQANNNQPQLKATGIEKRELWTTSNVKGSPEPPDPYLMPNAFPKLKFNEGLEMAAVPGKKQWVVAERGGKVFAFDNKSDAAEKTLVLDVKHTIYGVVLHPQFQANGFIYLSEVPDGSKEAQDGSHVMRYTVTDREKMTADPKSGKLIFTWPNGGHNGGCLRFGPDGFLYISTGDGSGIADGLQSGQDLGTVLGKINRIDNFGRTSQFDLLAVDFPRTACIL